MGSSACVVSKFRNFSPTGNNSELSSDYRNK